MSTPAAAQATAPSRPAQESRPAQQSRPTQELIDGPFLRNAWYVAAWAEELAVGKIVARTILDEPVALFRKADGTVAAIENRCSHRFAPLSLGRVLDGNRVQCAYHGLEFDGDGRCVLNPHGIKNVPTRAHLKSWPVIEKHHAAWIWMGDLPADQARIPDFQVLDDVPDLHGTKRDSIKIAANWQLIVDNLLDLSHGSYLHEGILGNQETAEAEIVVDQDGNDVVVSRHSTNAPAPGMFAQFWPGHPARIDKYTVMRWMAPSTLRLVSGICEPGTPFQRGGPFAGTGYHAIHMLTPETARSTHYFFTAVRYGVMTTDEKLNRELQAKIAKLRRFAFEEQDAPVIEAQQRLIEAAPYSLDPVILAIDAAPVRYKRVLAKLIAAES